MKVILKKCVCVFITSAYAYVSGYLPLLAPQVLVLE